MTQRSDIASRPGPGRAGSLRGRIKSPGVSALLIPGALFLCVVLLYPMLVMVWRSFTDPGIENYTELFETGLYLRVLFKTLQVGLIITLFCLLIGYPFTYLMTRVTPRWRLVLLAAVILPFWTSWLVRTFAWMALLQDTGVINDLLTGAGIVDEPLALIRNLTGITLGMSYIMLPFMVLPLYATMGKIDWTLVKAARSLGASPFKAFTRVYLPLSMPGVLAGSFLVFVVSLGFYVTPALLGSKQNMMVGELIVTNFSQNLAFGQSAAMSVILLATVVLLLWVAAKTTPIMRYLQGGNNP